MRIRMAPLLLGLFATAVKVQTWPQPVRSDRDEYKLSLCLIRVGIYVMRHLGLLLFAMASIWVELKALVSCGFIRE